LAEAGVPVEILRVHRVVLGVVVTAAITLLAVLALRVKEIPEALHLVVAHQLTVEAVEAAQDQRGLTP
jgi:hypothetical protein